MINLSWLLLFLFNLRYVILKYDIQQESVWAQIPPYVWLGSPQLRALLSPRVYTLPLVRCIGRTMVQGRNYGPQVTARRLATRKCPAVDPIFTQVASQIVKMDPADLRLPSRAWKVANVFYLLLSYIYYFNTIIYII